MNTVWRIVGESELYEPITQFDPSVQLTTVSTGLNIVNVYSVASGIDPIHFVSGHVDYLSNLPFPVNINGTITILSLTPADIPTKVRSQYGWEFVGWVGDSSQWMQTGTQLAGSEDIPSFVKVNVVAPADDFYFSVVSLQQYFAQEHAAVSVEVDYSLDIHTNIHNQSEKWVVGFTTNTRFTPNWQSNLPPFPFKYTVLIPSPILTFGSRAIEGRWKTYDHTATFNPNTNMVFVSGAQPSSNGRGFLTEQSSYEAYSVSGGVERSLKGVTINNSSANLSFLWFENTDTHLSSNPFVIIPNQLISPSIEAYESTVGPNTRLDIVNYEQMLSVNGLAPKDQYMHTIPNETYTTRTSTIQLSLIGNVFPVIYNRYQPPTVTINNGVANIISPQPERTVSYVNEYGAEISRVSSVSISSLAKPYPKKIGWMDEYGVVSQMVNVAISSVETVPIPCLITTTYNRNTRQIVITPNLVLPSTAEVYFLGSLTSRTDDAFYFTINTPLLNGVYVPTVVQDGYVFSYSRLVVNPEEQDTTFLAVIVISMFFAVGIVASSLAMK